MDYLPTLYADTRELITLARVLAEFGGVYASHLHDYGPRVAESNYGADITIFDPRTIMDRNSYAAPKEAPIGIKYVFVNGATALSQGQVTGAQAGRVLKPAWA